MFFEGNQRLKAQVWIDAQVRRCNLQALPFYVVRRGDPDAGMILIKLIRGPDRVLILSPARDEQGRPAWQRPLGEGEVPDSDGESWLSRQIDYDPDLWIVEIEDVAAAWWPDEPIL
ncbi:MAG: DUF1491 family protein [Rhodospirillales bacterium]|nr:DUF1491 family protein [Rhodospirillales bacterium]